jgi:hypothetical protein
MTTTHIPFSFIGGDDWEILATLLDEHGSPYDLTSAEIKWTLVDAAGKRVLDDGDFNITIIDASAGQCSIHVTAATTTTISSGRYTDALRIITGGVTSTLAIGSVMVASDPWKGVVQQSSTARMRLVAA